ncbi:MAG: acylneuraminate cytidylyltransferase family protein [Clostridiales Family XIII bacterium]|jgi:CMP-N-acetylneuraminic acid synthetase|nr:acylneuraminate cytidylyltransferase family protein [Clostridiales Family XIII bacterium]
MSGKVVAIVPIKLNNERLPGKNIKLLGGKPLIAYCLDTLLQIKEIDEVYVYCSNSEIERYLPLGVRFLKRPEKLDLPTSNFTQIFEMFMLDVDASIYVYAHATAPFVSADSIHGEIEAVSSGVYDSAFCAERIQDFLWRDGVPLNFDASNIPRSQELPVIWRETAGVYVFRKEVFAKLRRRVGTKPYIMEVDRKEAVDINTSDDFRYAELFQNWGESRNE